MPVSTQATASTPALDQLYFYLTEGCNLACRHCWLAPKFDPDGSRYPVLPVELFASILAEALPLGLTGVKLTGGEPLLHPRFLELLEIVQQHDLELTIESNGQLCSAEFVAAIARSNKRFVSISMDGADAGTHDAVRGVKGSFDLALEAVRQLAAAETPPQIIMSLMRHNAGQIEAMVRLAEDAGASSLKLNVILPSARGEKLHRGDQVPSVEELIALGRWVHTEFAEHSALPIVLDLPAAFRPLSTLAAGHGCGSCNIKGILGVLATGRYALCGVGEQIEELVFGTAGVDPLEQVWQRHPTLEALRQGLPERLGGVCASCLMRNSCLGSCVAQNYTSSGELFAPYWFCAQAERVGLFPESRQARPRRPEERVESEQQESSR